ncbi:MAG: trigger factor [Proteobacteria bacterium]|nr:trigger factor [Pseudomonadota bacterium]
MQVSVENVSNLERRVTVSLPSDRFNAIAGSRLGEIARSVRIKGFRPGKVPAKIIEQRYGPQVRDEVFGDLVRESFDEAVRKENLRPAGAPRIEVTPPAEGQMGYVATFEVVPEFGAIDVTTLPIVRATSEVLEADVDNMVETLRTQRRTWSPVERAAQAGDLVMVEMVTQAEGLRRPAEGEDRTATVIGSGMLDNELEMRLVGQSAGADVHVETSYAADWADPALAGKTATIDARVVRVSEPHMPQVDAEFIRAFGVRSGQAEDFRIEVRANLERELKGALMARLRAEVLDKLLAQFAHVELPARLIESEAQVQARMAEQNAREAGQTDPHFPIEGFLPVARQRVATVLLINEISRQHNIRLEPQRVNEMLRLIASTYEEPKQVLDLYRDNPRMMQELQGRVMEEQVIDWIAEQAHATEHRLSFADAMQQRRG